MKRQVERVSNADSAIKRQTDNKAPKTAVVYTRPEGVEFSPATEFTQAVMNLMRHLAHEERSEAVKRGWAKRRAVQVAG